jgi:hypothetical protein
MTNISMCLVPVFPAVPPVVVNYLTLDSGGAN